jgi:hypothetical protein
MVGRRQGEKGENEKERCAEGRKGYMQDKAKNGSPHFSR